MQKPFEAHYTKWSIESLTLKIIMQKVLGGRTKRNMKKIINEKLSELGDIIRKNNRRISTPEEEERKKKAYSKI